MYALGIHVDEMIITFCWVFGDLKYVLKCLFYKPFVTANLPVTKRKNILHYNLFKLVIFVFITNK